MKTLNLRRVIFCAFIVLVLLTFFTLIALGILEILNWNRIIYRPIPSAYAEATTSPTVTPTPTPTPYRSPKTYHYPAYDIPPQGINDVINEEGIKIGLTADEIDLAKHIAFCESQFNNNAVNVNKDGTTDKGVYQINSTHVPEMNSLGLVRTNLFDNVDFAMKMLKEQGTSPWKASSKCWQS